MIDFTKVKRRIKKHTVEEGDFYLVDISSKEGKDIAKKAGKRVDQQLAAFFRAMMCDDKGNLFNYTDDQLADIPIGLLQDVTAAVSALVYGEKKS